MIFIENVSLSPNFKPMTENWDGQKWVQAVGAYFPLAAMLFLRLLDKAWSKYLIQERDGRIVIMI